MSKEKDKKREFGEKRDHREQRKNRREKRLFMARGKVAELRKTKVKKSGK